MVTETRAQLERFRYLRYASALLFSGAPLTKGRWLRWFNEGGTDGVACQRLQDLFRVGRDPLLCQMVFSDPSVSRVHAEFRVTVEGAVMVVDLDSTNGLFRNGERTRQVELVNGDILGFGRQLCGFFEK